MVSSNDELKGEEWGEVEGKGSGMGCEIASSFIQNTDMLYIQQ